MTTVEDETPDSKPESPEPEPLSRPPKTDESPTKRKLESTVADEDSATEEDVDDTKALALSHSKTKEDSDLKAIGSEDSKDADDKPVITKNSEGSENDDKNYDKSSPGNSNLGRRGDPRMHKAVAARLANPEMSLLDALIAGGFVFPDGTEGAGKSDRNVYDSENVLLCQRKNQLSRRLRLARKGASSRFNEAAMSAQNLDNRQMGNDRVIYNGSAPGMLNPPLWQANSMPLVGAPRIGNPRLGHGHASNRAQGIMQMVLNQSNRQGNHTEHEILEARAALLANNNANYLNKNNGISSPERKKMKQEQDLQNLYMPAAGVEQLGVPNIYQHGLHHGQLPSSAGLMANQMHNLQQFRSQFHPSMLQNNVTAADLALHAAKKEQNGIDQYYLDLAAASMGMGKDKVQSILSNTDNAPAGAIPPNGKYPREAADIQQPNDGSKSDRGATTKEGQVDIAVKLYKTERASLVQRCLLMAGFNKNEISDDSELCDLFEKRLG